MLLISSHPEISCWRHCNLTQGILCYS